MRLELAVPLRWGDLDAYGHVNNVAMLRLLEEARIAAFWRHPGTDEDRQPTALLDGGPTATTHTLVARSEIEYLAALPYRRDGVLVRMWLGHLGGASIDVCYEVCTSQDPGAAVHARAVTTLVLVDAATGRPRRITADERAVWGAYVEAPVTMRRRPGG